MLPEEARLALLAFLSGKGTGQLVLSIKDGKVLDWQIRGSKKPIAPGAKYPLGFSQ